MYSDAIKKVDQAMTGQGTKYMIEIFKSNSILSYPFLFYPNLQSDLGINSELFCEKNSFKNAFTTSFLSVIQSITFKI